MVSVKSEDMLSRYDRIPACDRQTDRQTNKKTNSIVRAMYSEFERNFRQYMLKEFAFVC